VPEQKTSSTPEVLTPEFLRKQADLLEALLNEYRKKLQWLRRELGNNIGGEVRGDYVDWASAEEEREANAQGINHLKNLITQLQRALSSIQGALKGEKGNSEEYGKCQECGEPISLNRLKAVPWASLCTRCQQEQERISQL